MTTDIPPPTDLSVISLPDISSEIEATKASISKITRTEFLRLPKLHKESLQETLNTTLNARQKAWLQSGTDPKQCLQEIEEIKKLVLTQSLNGVSTSDLSLEFLFHDDEKLLFRMQRKLLDIYGRSPELARLIIDLSIVGGHGSRSGSLIGVLQHGLKPTEFQKTKGLPPLTGKYDWGGDNFNQISVSFVSWANERDLVDYSRSQKVVVNIQNLSGWMESYNKEIALPALSPTRKLILNRAKQMHDFLSKTDKTDIELDIEICLREDFPILYLIDNHTISINNTHIVDSDVLYEFCIDKGVLPENNPIILVPRTNIATVRKMANKYRWSGHIMDIDFYSKG